MSAVVTALARAGVVFAHSLAPLALSPDPLLFGVEPPVAALSAVGLAAFAMGAWVLRARAATRLAGAAAWLGTLAAVVSLVASFVVEAHGLPAASAALAVGPILWAALVAAAAAVFERWVPSTVKNRTALAGVATAALGGFLLLRASATLSSPSRMWVMALRAEPSHERALEALLPPLVRKKNAAEGRAAYDRCKAARVSCACVELGAALALSARTTGPMPSDECQARPRSAALAAIARARSGQDGAQEAGSSAKSGAGEALALVAWVAGERALARGAPSDALAEVERLRGLAGGAPWLVEAAADVEERARAGR